MKQKFIVIFFLTVFIVASATRPLVAAESRISIGVTETMETFNPYGDSVALMYSVWCQVLGCLGTYDFDKGQHVGLLVESWEVKDPKTWLFHLRKNNRFHDGSPVTAEDVVHSLKRTRDDPFTKQRQNISPVASEAAVDKYTVRITTKEPTAPPLDYLFDRVIVTSKAIYDKYGADVADRQYPIGAGRRSVVGSLSAMIIPLTLRSTGTPSSAAGIARGVLSTTKTWTAARPSGSGTVEPGTINSLCT